MSNEIEAKVTDILKKADVQVRVKLVGEKTTDKWRHDEWVITISAGNKSFATKYQTGIGWRPNSPHAADIFASLFIDAAADDLSFGNWCDELGYSADSIKAFDTYRACCDVAHKLTAVIPRDARESLATILQEY